MKSLFYIAGIGLVATACTTTRNLSGTMEDDIYYIPGQKALVVQEVEDLTGQSPVHRQETAVYNEAEETSSFAGSTTPPATFKRTPVVNARTGQPDQLSMQEINAQAQQVLAQNQEVNHVLYENTGYWIGGYKGNTSDFSEIQRIINMYPEGFAFFNTNGQDIAMNLSFDPDWNVFTDNGRYWWFPSSSNIDLYSSLLFGNYPKYIWTVVWDNPRFDSWAFDATFNRGFNLGLNIGLGQPGWSFGLGWNSGWYRPWYSPYYGFYDPWYDPWWGGYYPGWGYPHWHHPHWNHPHWNRPHPGWGPGPSYRPGTALRPNNGSGITGVRPGNALRPNSSSSIRPGSTTTGSSMRPGTTVRPNTGVSRPNSGVNRPNSGVTRPGNSNATRPMTRPGNNTTTRPNSGVSRPGTVRPVTPSTSRPQYTRPTPSTRQYTRPSTRTNSSGSPVKNYSRPQNNYRPTYNNNSSSRYNPGMSRPTSTPRSNSSYSPSRSSGSVSRPSTPVQRPTRPTRR